MISFRYLLLLQIFILREKFRIFIRLEPITALLDFTMLLFQSGKNSLLYVYLFVTQI